MESAYNILMGLLPIVIFIGWCVGISLVSIFAANLGAMVQQVTFVRKILPDFHHFTITMIGYTAMCIAFIPALIVFHSVIPEGPWWSQPILAMSASLIALPVWAFVLGLLVKKKPSNIDMKSFDW